MLVLPWNVVWDKVSSLLPICVHPVTLMILCLPMGALGERNFAKPSFTITPGDLSLGLQILCDKALGQHSHFPYSMDALMWVWTIETLQKPGMELYIILAVRGRTRSSRSPLATQLVWGQLRPRSPCHRTKKKNESHYKIFSLWRHLPVWDSLRVESWNSKRYLSSAGIKTCATMAGFRIYLFCFDILVRLLGTF